MIRAYLVGTVKYKEDVSQIEDQLKELGKLVWTLNYEVVGSIIAPLKEINPRTYIGKGKAQEIERNSTNLIADVIVFNDDLSPSQHFFLEKIFNEKKFNVRLFDRSEIILEIFSKNARTKVAKTQVELAKLRYMLPKLKRRWTHLERQRGGIGALRGVGEKQIEIDRRIIYDRISKLKKELEKIDVEQNTQRKKREELFKVSLVGYTNGGKSTILKALTGYSAFIQDKLFATLDSKVKSLPTSSTPKILITDTVGFIRKLPEHLFTSFKSTLDEIVNADLLLLVADISDKNYMDYVSETKNILAELKANSKPTIYVFNKKDILNNEDSINEAKRHFPTALFVSALSTDGINELREAIIEEYKKTTSETTLRIPYNKYSLVQFIRDNGKILKEDYKEKYIFLSFSATPAIIRKVRNQISS